MERHIATVLNLVGLLIEGAGFVMLARVTFSKEDGSVLLSGRSREERQRDVRGFWVAVGGLGLQLIAQLVGAMANW